MSRLTDELERLHDLHQMGGLTDEEFSRAKARLIESIGAPQAKHPFAALRRRRSDAWLAGLCAGLTNYTGMPVALLRSGFALLTLAGGLGVLLYTVLALLIPIEES